MTVDFSRRTHALGEHPSETILKNCRLVNVLSGRIEENASIAISGGRVVGIGDYSGQQEYDMGGKFVYPGLIDAHIHLESSKMTIPECARAMSRQGTTTVITDPHEIANVSSIEGISYQLDTAAYNERMSVFFTVPSCVPAIPDPEIETFAAYLGPTKLKTFFNNPWFVVLGEMMNMPGAIFGDEKVLEKIGVFRERNIAIDGHAPMLRGKELNTYIYLGIRSDHESTSVEEAREKLDRGMHLMIREGSTESNLHDLLPIITPLNSSRIMFASDDLDPLDLAERGHLNYILREAVSAGLSPIQALQMATINPAQYFGLRDYGAIFPGAWADLVVAEDLEQFQPVSVMRGGRWVVYNSEEQAVGKEVDRFLRSTMNVTLPETEAMAVRARSGSKLRCIGVIENQIVTNELLLEPVEKGGAVVASPGKDIAKIAVFDRHRNSGSFSIGFIHGLGLKRGAIASSVAHDSHNLIVAGMDDESMMRAAHRVRGMGGGQVALAGAEEALLPLPVAGLMSDARFESVAGAERGLIEFCKKELGSPLERVISTLSFMALPVIPTLKITDKGLFRIEPGAYPEKAGIFAE